MSEDMSGGELVIVTGVVIRRVQALKVAEDDQSFSH